MTITLTAENAGSLAFFVELTGLPAEALVNWLLADYLKLFTPDDDSGYVEETLGLLKFNDRPAAERTLSWVRERIKDRCDGQLPEKFRCSVEELSGGRFRIHALYTDHLGEEQRLV